MVKRQSPRILAASALAALVVGLSACGTPQTLVPYTPAEGVNADAPRLGAAAGANQVPLKIRNLVIVSKPGSGTGFLSGALIAPVDRNDALVRVEGNLMTSDNTQGQAIPPITANLDLPAGKMVNLVEQPSLTIASPALTPGLVADLTLTFRDSEPQTLKVPIVDGNKPDYASVTPVPATTATASAAPTTTQPPG